MARRTLPVPGGIGMVTASSRTEKRCCSAGDPLNQECDFFGKPKRITDQLDPQRGLGCKDTKSDFGDRC